MTHRILAASLLVLAAFAPQTAEAQYGDSRRSTTHALYVGGRFDPGAAFLAGYDLEVELGTPCGFNLGPSLSVAFLGGEGGEGQQDVLGTLDLLRGRFLLDESSCGNCGYRLQALLGAGMYFVMNPAVDVPRFVGSSPKIAGWVDEHFVERWRFGAQITGGLSADWWLSRDLGITGILAVHVRLDDYARMPAIWAEAGLGVRFGT